MEKRKLKITSEVLNEVTAEFPETKEFIEERLEQKCAEENISVEEVIYIFTSIFYFVVLGFQAETFWFELHLTKHVKRHNIKLKLLGYDIHLLVIWV